MTEKELKEYACRLSSLSVFRRILEDETVSSLLAYMKNAGSLSERLALYGAFVHSLQESDISLSAVLSRLVCEDENSYIKRVSRRESVPASMEANAQAELTLFTELTRLTPKSLTECLPYEGYLPSFENEALDLKAVYTERLSNIERY